MGLLWGIVDPGLSTSLMIRDVAMFWMESSANIFHELRKDKYLIRVS